MKRKALDIAYLALIFLKVYRVDKPVGQLVFACLETLLILKQTLWFGL